MLIFIVHYYSIPFISLSCSRKCEQYMIENDLQQHLFKFKTNNINLPIEINSKSIINFININISSKSILINKLKKIMELNITKMNEFIGTLISIYKDNL